MGFLDSIKGVADKVRADLPNSNNLTEAEAKKIAAKVENATPLKTFKANTVTNGSGQGDRELPDPREDTTDRSLPDSKETYLNEDIAPQNKPVEASTNDSKTIDVKLYENDFQIIPNVLNGYASYTYCISLHALPIEAYNALVLDREKKIENHYKADHVLVASAGKKGEKFKRDGHFSEDFFFDEFKMTTVIGANRKSRFSNAIDISFTIIEPYGVTLLQRMIDTARDLKCKLHTQLPYLIQIDFYGYSDTGIDTRILDITKYIPVKLIDMKLKAGPKGTTYQFQAIPFNHQAYSDTAVHSPANFVVEANTVGEFFIDSRNTSDIFTVRGGITLETEARKKLDEDNKRLTQLSKQAETDEYNEGKLTSQIAQLKEDVRKDAADVTKYSAMKRAVKSYVNGFNVWLENLKDTNLVETADHICVKIEESAIWNAKIEFRETASSTDVAMGYDQEADKRASYASRIMYRPGVKGVTVPMGMSTVDVITKAIINSSYIRDQLKDPLFDGKKIVEDNKEATESHAQAVADKKGKPLDWFKITPVVEIIGPMGSNNVYPKKITYVVSKAKLHNAKLDTAEKSVPTNIVKEYNYMFTGQNIDVIDFEIDYNMAYYTSVTADRVNANAQNISKTDQKDDEDPEGPVVASKTADDGMAPPTRYVAKASEVTDAKTIMAKDLQRSLLADQRGDMISVNLKIIGDPDFIKQDDLFYSYGDTTTQGLAKRTSNLSILTDIGDVNVGVNFKTAVDYDERGIMNPNDDTQAYTSSVFDGVYRVLTVESLFKSGAFTQNLTIIRYPNQVVRDKKINTVRSFTTENGLQETRKDTGGDWSYDDASAPTELKPDVVKSNGLADLQCSADAAKLPGSASEYADKLMKGGTGGIGSLNGMLGTGGSSMMGEVTGSMSSLAPKGTDMTQFNSDIAAMNTNVGSGLTCAQNAFDGGVNAALTGVGNQQAAINSALKDATDTSKWVPTNQKPLTDEEKRYLG